MTKKEKYSLYFSDSSKRDLSGIHQYILENFYSKQAADGKVSLILEALENLTVFPEICPLISSRGYGDFTTDGKKYRYMPVENYIVLYYLDEQKVYISRILNMRQDWVQMLNN